MKNEKETVKMSISGVKKTSKNRQKRTWPIHLNIKITNKLSQILKKRLKVIT